MTPQQLLLNALLRVGLESFDVVGSDTEGYTLTLKKTRAELEQELEDLGYELKELNT